MAFTVINWQFFKRGEIPGTAHNLAIFLPNPHETPVISRLSIICDTTTIQATTLLFHRIIFLVTDSILL